MRWNFLFSLDSTPIWHVCDDHVKRKGFETATIPMYDRMKSEEYTLCSATQI